MTARKNRHETENEAKWEYRRFQKSERGDKLVGEEASDIYERGTVADVVRARRAYHEEHADPRHPGRGD